MSSTHKLWKMSRDLPKVRTILRDYGGPHLTILGKLNETARLTWKPAEVDVGVEDLAQAWRRPLDW